MELSLFQNYAIDYFLDGYKISEIAGLLNLSEKEVAKWFKLSIFKKKLHEKSINKNEILNRLNQQIENELYEDARSSYYNWQLEIESRHLSNKLLLPSINNFLINLNQKNVEGEEKKEILNLIKDLSYLSNKNSEILLKINEQQLKLNQITIKLNQLENNN